MWLRQHMPYALGQQILRQGRVYALLSKGRLSFFVAVSAVLGYLFAASYADLLLMFFLFVGGWWLSAGASTFNQYLEQDYDKCMHRTQGRPLPKGLLSKKQALYWGIFSTVSGLLLLYLGTNPGVAGLAGLALLLYVGAYTSLKRVGPVAVLVGAIPGAMPPLLGCVAAQGSLAMEGILLFGIQFMWQFPHFWAIAWLAHKDYQKAGFKLLPGGGCGPRAAAHIMLYTLFLLPISLLPTHFGVCGLAAATVALLAGGGFTICALCLLLYQSQRAARRLMWASFLYLPLVQMSYVLDKL